MTSTPDAGDLEALKDRVAELEAGLADTRAELAALKALLKQSTNDGSVSSQTPHPEIDFDAFARQVKTHPFIPTQAMLDEDWSDLIPEEGE